jgi:hypothetical protein
MSKVAAVPDLERELDDLYGLPLGQFTSARNDLVSRLKKAHQAESAAAVHALRKPSVVVWTANHLARTQPDLVAELVEAAARLRDVQQHSLGGDGLTEVAEAAARERAAVRALIAATDATAQTRDRLAQTLHAAAVDPGSAALLVRGRLTDELDAVGFGPLSAVPDLEPRPSKSDEARRQARERVTELRKEARQLDRKARLAEIAVQQATVAADEARREAERAASELQLAEAELKDPR